ncbi:UNVERIFIED_CONTAM: hypothetical protein Sradi_0991000 [Sesamum radiatum]|uniref:Uncharacterized protein n=1 Tax=Sesamum radiatum TaxID=300843 RepID=A0AAW2V7V3_SESRA
MKLFLCGSVGWKLMEIDSLGSENRRQSALMAEARNVTTRCLRTRLPRGKTSTDQRSKPPPGTEIPNRPAGQRPDTAPSPEANNLSDTAVGRTGRFIPVRPAAISNSGMPAGFDGMLSPIFSFHFHEFSNASGYGGVSGYGYGYPSSLQDLEGGLSTESSQSAGSNDESLRRILLFILVLVFFGLLTM